MMCDELVWIDDKEDDELNWEYSIGLDDGKGPADDIHRNAGWRWVDKEKEQHITSVVIQME